MKDIGTPHEVIGTSGTSGNIIKTSKEQERDKRVWPVDFRGFGTNVKPKKQR